MKEIKFKTNRGNCYSPCPLKEPTMIGSSNCFLCKFNKGLDFENRIVKCCSKTVIRHYSKEITNGNN